mmetsp:Transcript_11249/g.24356  ORF Transcript_11249/g.24356 Transcript_11249/m.24356 type:complete len:280 (+) Transcript_11249:281-1120(+)
MLCLGRSRPAQFLFFALTRIHQHRNDLGVRWPLLQHGHRHVLDFRVPVLPPPHVLPHHLPRLRIHPVQPPVHPLVRERLQVECALELLVKSIHRRRQLGEEHRRVEPPPHLVQRPVDYHHGRVRPRRGHLLAVHPILDRAAVPGLYHQPQRRGGGGQVVQCCLVPQQAGVPVVSPHHLRQSGHQARSPRRVVRRFPPDGIVRHGLDGRKRRLAVSLAHPFLLRDLALLQVGEDEPRLPPLVVAVAQEHGSQEHGPVLVPVEFLDVVEVVELGLALAPAE